MKITIDLEQVCTELANSRVEEASAFRKYEEIYIEEEDCERFTDEFQHIFDIWYEFYLNKLKTFI